MNLELALKVPAVGDLEDKLEYSGKEIIRLGTDYLVKNIAIARKAYDTVREDMLSRYPNQSHVMVLPHQTKQESYDIWVVDRKEVYDNSKEVTAFLKEHYKVGNLFFHEFNSGARVSAPRIRTL